MTRKQLHKLLEEYGLASYSLDSLSGCYADEEEYQRQMDEIEETIWEAIKNPAESEEENE